MTLAERIRLSAPCSIEMPAGCGKTELIAQLAGLVAQEGRRSLVLTHTHAGVDALRRRMRKGGLPPDAYQISTIDSWCFELIRRFPYLSDIKVEHEPDWALSREYHEAGAKAVLSRAVKKMLRVSYGMVIIDEYQDCQKWQHALVSAVADVLPACVMGDRMQGLFFFGDRNNPVVWESDVISRFPALEIQPVPWRWVSTNPHLGEWLLGVRSDLMAGQSVDLSAGPVTVVQNTDDQVASLARRQPPHPDKVALIMRWPKHCAALASRLGGSYSMIEELEGRHLLEFADVVDRGQEAEVASATVAFAISCAFGVATSIDLRSRKRLADGKRMSSSNSNSAQVEALNDLVSNVTAERVLFALTSISKLPGFRLHRREAWYGVLAALRVSSASAELSVRDAVIGERNRLRVRGRFPESRIVARPLLIKGLEFEHAVVVGTDGYNAHELYVCLTRGTRTLSIATSAPFISTPRPEGARIQV